MGTRLYPGSGTSHRTATTNFAHNDLVSNIHTWSAKVCFSLGENLCFFQKITIWTFWSNIEKKKKTHTNRKGHFLCLRVDSPILLFEEVFFYLLVLFVFSKGKILVCFLYNCFSFFWGGGNFCVHFCVRCAVAFNSSPECCSSAYFVSIWCRRNVQGWPSCKISITQLILFWIL